MPKERDMEVISEREMLYDGFPLCDYKEGLLRCRNLAVIRIITTEDCKDFCRFHPEL